MKDFYGWSKARPARPGGPGVCGSAVGTLVGVRTDFVLKGPALSVSRLIGLWASFCGNYTHDTRKSS